jgi:hypothetical protein
MMFTIRLDTKASNKLMAEGKIGSVLERTMATIKPEASYFTSTNGRRTMILFADLPDVSDMPRFSEQLWIDLEAEIDCVPVMSLNELQQGLQKAFGGK